MTAGRSGFGRGSGSGWPRRSPAFPPMTIRSDRDSTGGSSGRRPSRGSTDRAGRPSFPLPRARRPPRWTLAGRRCGGRAGRRYRHTPGDRCPRPAHERASARRWATVRGSASHTAVAIAVSRASSSLASVASNRPQMGDPVAVVGSPSRSVGPGRCDGYAGRHRIDGGDPHIDGRFQFAL